MNFNSRFAGWIFTSIRDGSSKVPLSEMFGYVTVLRTISSGRATSSMEFSHFEEVPANLAKEIIEKSSGKRKEIE